MPLIKNFGPKHPGQAGSLGVVQRSIGYLQGGYKDSVMYSKVQLFNTVTQVGSIVYDTGYARSYRPGIAGNFNGYFSIIFMVEYAAYLLSPTHKCLAIAATYFDTKPKAFYNEIGKLAVLMVVAGALVS